jgi:hypothetical protein
MRRVRRQNAYATFALVTARAPLRQFGSRLFPGTRNAELGTAHSPLLSPQPVKIDDNNYEDAGDDALPERIYIQ